MPDDLPAPIAEGSYEWYRRKVERLRGELAEAKRVIAAQPKPSAVEELRETIAEILDNSDETAVDAFLYFAAAEVARIAGGEMTARWRAEDERDAAHAAIARVRALHSPRDRGAGPECMGCKTKVTFTPYEACPTLAALDGPSGTESHMPPSVAVGRYATGVNPGNSRLCGADSHQDGRTAPTRHEETP